VVPAQISSHLRDIDSYSAKISGNTSSSEQDRTNTNPNNHLTNPPYNELLSEGNCIIKEEHITDTEEEGENNNKVSDSQQNLILDGSTNPTSTSSSNKKHKTANFTSNIEQHSGSQTKLSSSTSSSSAQQHNSNGIRPDQQTGLPNDLPSAYKVSTTGLNNLSPSSSSSSTNTPTTSSSRHDCKPHTEDPSRKREMRLQKNREAARECRRKKKEYIKCLEERVTGLENQNKALIEELRQLKELYCQSHSTTTTESDINLLTEHTRRMSASMSETSTPIQLPLSPLTSSGPTSLFLPWDRLKYWLHAIVVVTFDLELGQSIELLLPHHCKLSDKEKLNLCYLSFPDANSTFLGDTQYHFRIKHDSWSSSSSQRYHLPSSMSYYEHYNRIVPSVLQVDPNYLYGYVHFRQVRDKSIKRGYFQKSVVLLSKLPFISLFLSIVSQLGPNYFELGLTSLETCCHLMDNQWPEPEPGKTLLLPLLGNVLQVRIPTHGDKPFSSSDLIQFRTILNNTNNRTIASSSQQNFPIDDSVDTINSTLNNNLEESKKNYQNHSQSTVSLPSMSTTKQIEMTTPVDKKLSSDNASIFLQHHEQQLPRLIPFVHDVNTYQSLACVLNHIQLLWELVLLNEPIAVLGTFPTNCSQTVQAIVHIIWPLRYASDYRPFFTIHNSEFHEYTFNTSTKKTNSDQQPSVIIGVTNPFFAKLLHNWPHIIRVFDSINMSETKKKERYLLIDRNLSDDDEGLSVNEVDEDLGDVQPPTAPTKKVTTTIKPYKRKSTPFRGSNSHLTFDMKPGLYTKYKTYLQRDKTILKKLQNSVHQRPDNVQNTLLRRFFLELTQSFIIPLERYFTSLLPLKKFCIPNRKQPSIKPFDNDEFLKTIELYGPQLTSGLKGDWKELYKHFLQTPNFKHWLYNRQTEAELKIFSLHIETTATCHLENDLLSSITNEIELIDLLLKLNDYVSKIESNQITIDDNNKGNLIEKLKLKINIIINDKLSDDMKTLFSKQVNFRDNNESQQVNTSFVILLIQLKYLEIRKLSNYVIRYISTALPNDWRKKLPSLNEKDLEEKYIKGSGPGGQAINKTQNCCQIKHIPTGIVVTCQQTRFLETNRVLARRQLQERLDYHFNGEDSLIAQYRREKHYRKEEKRLETLKTLEKKRAFKIEQKSQNLFNKTNESNTDINISKKKHGD
ncbi:unnamed protein product, partial [Didymodactylos carnosus]